MVDKAEYQNRWNSQIEELTRLGWYLNEADRDRISEIKEELEEIVQVAANNKELEETEGTDGEREEYTD